MALPNTVRVSTWHELQDELYRDAWQAELERFRPTVAFRGVAHARYELVNSLARLGPVSTEFEGHILRNFRKYAQRNIVPVDSVWNWLAVAQHYGLPTRLLDWTYSPYVALHFATECLDTFTDDEWYGAWTTEKLTNSSRTHYKTSLRRKGQWYSLRTC